MATEVTQALLWVVLGGLGFGQVLLESVRQKPLFTYYSMIQNSSQVTSVHVESSVYGMCIFMFGGAVVAFMNMYSTPKDSTRISSLGWIGLLLWFAGNVATAATWDSTPRTTLGALQVQYTTFALLNSCMISFGAGMCYWSSRACVMTIPIKIDPKTKRIADNSRVFSFGMALTMPFWYILLAIVLDAWVFTNSAVQSNVYASLISAALVLVNASSIFTWERTTHDVLNQNDEQKDEPKLTDQGKKNKKFGERKLFVASIFHFMFVVLSSVAFLTPFSTLILYNDQNEPELITMNNMMICAACGGLLGSLSVIFLLIMSDRIHSSSVNILACTFTLMQCVLLTLVGSLSDDVISLPIIAGVQGVASAALFAISHLRTATLMTENKAYTPINLVHMLSVLLGVAILMIITISYTTYGIVHYRHVFLAVHACSWASLASLLVSCFLK